ncbi:MAG: bifunctional riboflavin kinase/FAD synthetase [Desulfobacteraceae bacterium]|nr:bifunctional riboflavin kinase/FAD synthetase [Desulfobacteraceae bacterium]
MEVYYGIEEIHRPLKNPTITIGNFDGVHRGHQALFQRVKEWSHKLDGESIVMTFNPHPLEVLFPGKGPAYITTHERKMELIASCGIDATIVMPFNRDFALVSARDFVKDILVDRIGIKAIVVGYDYRFGNSRAGDIDLLRDLGREFGFEVDPVAGIRLEDKVVSSTVIRQLIRKGELKEANKLLGRPFEVLGIVVPGRKRGGALLGFPTANIRMSSQTSPGLGVYAVEADVGGKTYGGAANLGYNPTFGDTDLSLEVFLFDFSGDIYGQPITVRLLERLRSEQRFASLEDLIAQIRLDVQQAKKILEERKSVSPG